MLVKMFRLNSAASFLARATSFCFDFTAHEHNSAMHFLPLLASTQLALGFSLSQLAYKRFFLHFLQGACLWCVDDVPYT
jgi:hypothetical protein